MENGEYHNLLHRIKKSYPKFSLKGKDSKKLVLVDGEKEKIVGGSHRDENNIVFGYIQNNQLTELGECDHRNLKEIFEMVEKLISVN